MEIEQEKEKDNKDSKTEKAEAPEIEQEEEKDNKDSKTEKAEVVEIEQEKEKDNKDSKTEKAEAPEIEQEEEKDNKDSKTKKVEVVKIEQEEEKENKDSKTEKVEVVDVEQEKEEDNKDINKEKEKPKAIVVDPTDKKVQEFKDIILDQLEEMLKQGLDLEQAIASLRSSSVAPVVRRVEQFELKNGTDDGEEKPKKSRRPKAKAKGKAKAKAAPAPKAKGKAKAKAKAKSKGGAKKSDGADEQPETSETEIKDLEEGVAEEEKDDDKKDDDKNGEKGNAPVRSHARALPEGRAHQHLRRKIVGRRCRTSTRAKCGAKWLKLALLFPIGRTVRKTIGLEKVLGLKKKTVFGENDELPVIS